MFKTQLLEPLMHRLAAPVYSLIDGIDRQLPDLDGNILETDQMVKACILACVRREGLHAVTDGWVTPEGVTISSDTFNKHLRGTNELGYKGLGDRLQAAYDEQMRRSLEGYNGPLIAALDYHEERVYEKKGTHSPLARFTTGRQIDGKKVPVLRYLTCSLVHPFHQVAAVRFIGPLDDGNNSLKGIVYHLRDNFGIDLYLLDRGFYSYEVINWFQQESGVDYLMPAPRSPRVKPIIAQSEIDLSQFEGRFVDFIQRIPHEIASVHGTEAVELRVVTSKPYLQFLNKRHFDQRDKRVRKVFAEAKTIAFVTNRLDLVTPKLINMTYRLRWRIENGYREILRLEAATRTPKITLRVFWFNLACLLENLWEMVRRATEKTTMARFKRAMEEICHQSFEDGYTMIRDENRRLANLKSIHQLAMKTSHQDRRVQAGQG